MPDLDVTRLFITGHQLFIAGRWVDSVSGATFDSVNPADTRDVIGTFQAGTAADVAMASPPRQKRCRAGRRRRRPSGASCCTGSAP